MVDGRIVALVALLSRSVPERWHGRLDRGPVALVSPAVDLSQTLLLAGIHEHEGHRQPVGAGLGLPSPSDYQTAASDGGAVFCA